MGVYEERAVLFLDILGFSDLVQSGRGHRLLGALEHLQGRAIEAQVDGKLDFTAFSDCVVVSTPLNDGKGALRIVTYAQFLALDLLAKGFMTRGAIVTGQLHHRGAIVLGPALVDAYRLESKKALYPRILVSHSIVGSVYDAASKASIGDSFAFLRPYFREDFDGAMHIDIFEQGRDIPEMYWGDEEGNEPAARKDAFRNSLLTFMDNIFASPTPPVAEEKYAWLARYFFEKCKNNLWPLPNNLPISAGARMVYEADLAINKAADEQE